MHLLLIGKDQFGVFHSNLHDPQGDRFYYFCWTRNNGACRQGRVEGSSPSPENPSRRQREGAQGPSPGGEDAQCRRRTCPRFLGCDWALIPAPGAAATLPGGTLPFPARCGSAERPVLTRVQPALAPAWPVITPCSPFPPRGQSLRAAILLSTRCPKQRPSVSELRGGSAPSWTKSSAPLG